MAKAEEFAALPVGAEYTFWFDPTSREYQGKYYTQCTCFNWQAADAYQSQTQSPAPAAPAPAPQPAAPQAVGGDDLPY